MPCNPRAGKAPGSENQETFRENKKYFINFSYINAVLFSLISPFFLPPHSQFTSFANNRPIMVSVQIIL